MKAFLSHSSKQKDFVEIVAKNLSDIAVIDSKSFESGLENKDEIITNINSCNIFVIFLSDEALESEWVKLEIDYAKARLEEGLLKRIYPIIIDDRITHNDIRIPSWLKTDYNLKYIARSGKVSHLIKRRIQELVWDQHPTIKKSAVPRAVERAFFLQP